MTPADRLAAEEARRQFALEVSQDAGAIDVARAALLIAAEEAKFLPYHYAEFSITPRGFEVFDRRREG